MFTGYADGYCLQCELDNQQIPMQLNRGDFWECPNCHLQASGNGGRFMLHRTRGVGDFKSYTTLATEYIVGNYVVKQSTTDPYAVDGFIFNEEDLRQFIQHDIRNPTKLCVIG
jgi:hypothetical protein